MRYLIILLCMFFISEAIGQVDNSRAIGVNTTKALEDIVDEIQSLDNAKTNDIVGTPYFVDTWAPGRIKTTANNVFENVLLLYDHFNEQLIYKKEKSYDSLFVNMKVVKEFSLFYDDTVRFVRHDELALNSDYKYYQVLFEGNVLLLREAKKEILQFDSDSSSPTESLRRFITRDRLLLIENKRQCEIKSRRKKALDCFDKNAKKIEVFVKEHKINFGEEKEVVKVVKYYDKII